MKKLIYVFLFIALVVACTLIINSKEVYVNHRLETQQGIQMTTNEADTVSIKADSTK